MHAHGPGVHMHVQVAMWYDSIFNSQLCFVCEAVPRADFVLFSCFGVTDLAAALERSGSWLRLPARPPHVIHFGGSHVHLHLGATLHISNLQVASVWYYLLDLQLSIVFVCEAVPRADFVLFSN